MSINPLNIVGYVIDIYKARQQAKVDKEVAQAKVKQAVAEGETQLELTKAQWESIAVAQTEHSWKDEYVTIVITSPILLILLGGIAASLTGSTAILDGTIAGITALESTGVDMGLLMQTVVFAAIGLKFVRGK